MPRKQTLRLLPEEEFEFKLIGIFSAENDYKISWLINKTLNINLVRDGNIGIPINQNVEQTFSHYFYEDKSEQIVYRLISNKSDYGCLIPELKNLDYFFKIRGFVQTIVFQQIMEKLHTAGIFEMLTEIDPLKLKSRRKFLVRD